jgi:hypothetical protein
VQSNQLSAAISLAPSLFIEVSVRSQESERSCSCVQGVFILSLSTRLVLDFEIVTDSVVVNIINFKNIYKYKSIVIIKYIVLFFLILLKILILSNISYLTFQGHTEIG